jgi:HEAT repeats/Putative zinc-finger
MECKDYREQFPLLLTDALDENQRRELEKHLAVCAECREEFEATGKIWDLMGEIPQPEPSAAMRAGFSEMLADFKEEAKVIRKPSGEWVNKLRGYWSYQVQPRLAISLFLVAFGLIAGYILHQPGQSVISYNKQIDSLSSQVSEIKQVMLLSLLNDPSASQRIRAVSYSDEISNVNQKVIGALFTTLNEDPNVNVRLATLEALVKLAGEPKVREGLVRSIDLQESPLMQSAIADAMVILQEKSSVPYLQKLLNKKDLNQMVKINIEKNIQKLIWKPILN